MPKEKIAFLDVASFSDGKILRGGVLVCDLDTEPLEFRCTTPVRPTQLQKILWGARLSEHIAANLLGAPLLRALEQEFSLVLVRDADFLELRERGGVSVPVVRLTKHGEIDFDTDSRNGSKDALSDEDTDTQGEAGETTGPVLLESTSGKFEPVVVSSHFRFGRDVTEAREILKPIFATKSIIEPFERIQSALAAVHEEEAKKDK